MRTPETLVHGRMGINQCPLCDQKFGDQKALHNHVLSTKKHASILHEVWRLRFLLEEAERDAKVIRGQRNEWRKIAQERRVQGP